MKIYVDDTNGVCKALKPGTVYKEGKLIHDDQKYETYKNIPSDKITMEVNRDIANEVDEMIVITADIPSHYNDGKIPMLDVKVWINDNDKSKIYYTFSEKPTKSSFVLSKTSSMPISKKIECLGQEVFRRLHNTKKEIDEEYKVAILNEFMVKLKISGYNKHNRYQFLRSGFNAYENLRTKEDKGIRPFFSKNMYNKEKRKEEKREKKNSWFQKKTGGQEINQYSSVFFVQSTPGSILVKMLRETEERFKIDDKCRIRFLETSGGKYIDQL